MVRPRTGYSRMRFAAKTIPGSSHECVARQRLCANNSSIKSDRRFAATINMIYLDVTYAEAVFVATVVDCGSEGRGSIDLELRQSLVWSGKHVCASVIRDQRLATVVADPMAGILQVAKERRYFLHVNPPSRNHLVEDLETDPRAMLGNRRSCAAKHFWLVTLHVNLDQFQARQLRADIVKRIDVNLNGRCRLVGC